MPPVTRNILIANVALFLVVMTAGEGVFESFALYPLGAGFMPWQLVTYGFVHGGVMHIAFNMLGVWQFGSDLERVWGSRKYLVYYLACAVAAGLTQLGFAAVTGSVYPTVGASGALFGLLLAFAMIFPHRKVLLLFPPIPMRAPIFVAVFGIIELFLGVTGSVEGVAHFAHLGGLAGGFVLLKLWKQRPY